MSPELAFLDTCVLIDGLYKDSDHNGVKKIYTFNVTDFTPFGEIEVIEPKAP